MSAKTVKNNPLNNGFPSARMYCVICVEFGIISKNNVTLPDLLLINLGGAEMEYKYAMYEKMDEILDLKRLQSMYFQPNRDDDNSKGIITRIN